MKLYLASLNIPDQQAFLALFPTNRRLAIIANANDPSPPGHSTPYIEATKKQLRNMHFSWGFIDLRTFAGKTAQLQQELGQYDGVWVLGGNTFHLNKVMQESGFKEALLPLLAKGYVYGGESAGAVMAGTTLHGVEYLDDPHVVVGDTPWNGMCLVDYGIVPHWDTPEDQSALEACKAEMERYARVVTLTNDQHITTE